MSNSSKNFSSITTYKDFEHNRFCPTSDDKVGVRTCTEITSDVPVYEVQEGESFNRDFSGVTSPGVAITILNEAIPAGKNLRPIKLQVTCRLAGKYEVKAGNDVIASGRTGASSMNSKFVWHVHREITAGTVLRIEFTEASWQPMSDIEAYFEGILLDISA